MQHRFHCLGCYNVGSSGLAWYSTGSNAFNWVHSSHTWLQRQGQVLTCGNRSTETEVHKLKWKEKRLIGVQCLYDTRLCALRPYSQRVTLSLQCVLQRASLSRRMWLLVSVGRPKPRLTVSGPRFYDCVSACWILIRMSVLGSNRDWLYRLSHPLATRPSRESVRH